MSNSYRTEFAWEKARGLLLSKMIKRDYSIDVCLKEATENQYMRCIQNFKNTLETFANSKLEWIRKVAEWALIQGNWGDLKIDTDPLLPTYSFFSRLFAKDSHQKLPFSHLKAMLLHPTFLEFFQSVNPTLWITPNDEYASTLLHWMGVFNLKVPKEISVLSFDNQVESGLIPINRVDFGFDTLAHQVFHYITFKEKPYERKKSIAAKAYVSDRGSVSFPG